MNGDLLLTIFKQMEDHFLKNYYSYLEKQALKLCYYIYPSLIDNISILVSQVGVSKFYPQFLIMQLCKWNYFIFKESPNWLFIEKYGWP